MKLLRELKDLKGKKVILRTDFNVLVSQGVVVDDFRIKSALPNLDFLLKNGAKVLIISHIEDNKSKDIPTLQPIATYLSGIYKDLVFATDIFQAKNALNSNNVVLLENIRKWQGEKDNDDNFCNELASGMDIYVNEAFSVSHRKHASVYGIATKLSAYAGLQFEKEVNNLSKAFSPEHPFLFIIGGAKFETKLPIISKFLNKADKLFIGGALANDLLVRKGFNVGRSLVSETNIDLGLVVEANNVLLPIDVVIEDKQNMNMADFGGNNQIMDSGTATLQMLQQEISKARFILWNGPLGLYENGYKEGTLAVAKMIGSMSDKGVITIVGGGDTLTAISELGLNDRFSFISTGGGAMLDFLAQGTLPGIEVLK
jgi:3-phosphoglycerate kinase